MHCVMLSCVYSPEMVPPVLDDDKMNTSFDEEAIMKLLNKFYDEREIQQVTNCETKPQMIMHEASEYRLVW